MSSERLDVLEDPLPVRRCQERHCQGKPETSLDTPLGVRWYCPRHYRAREEHYRVIAAILTLPERDIL